MFGKNEIKKQELSDGRVLRVVKGSPFATIQGEGPFAGHPAVFVRLHGCNLRCYFCDTEFSDPRDPEIEMVRLARLVYDESKRFPTSAEVGVEAMGDIAVSIPMIKLVVITGGEPMRQNIVPFIKLLLQHGFEVQIETAGTLWLPELEEMFDIKHGRHLHIVCSPKTGKVHDLIKTHASAFKYVIKSDTKFTAEGIPLANTQGGEGAKEFPLAAPRSGCPIYLSPMDEYDAKLNAENKRIVAYAAQRYRYIAGIQLHKELEIVEP